jgi:CHASE3 domain sensor protein
MIRNSDEYQAAQDELHQLEQRLQQLQVSHPLRAKGFTKAGIRKLIARLHEELAVYEGGQESKQADPS